MGVSRYSRDPSKKRHEQQFDEMQMRCNVDYYSPTLAEIIEVGIYEARYRCANPQCQHPGEMFLLDRYWSGMKVRDIKARQTCGKCKGRKVDFQLQT